MPARKRTDDKKDWGEYGPAMRALTSPRMRAFVEAYVLGTLVNRRKDNFGAQSEAAVKAGYGNKNGSDKRNLNSCRVTACRLLQDTRIVAAVTEVMHHHVRAAAPEAVAALMDLVHDKEHKSHFDAVKLLMDRFDPAAQHTAQAISVTHRVIDAQTEALEELWALRQLGTPRQKLLEVFGENGLARIEQLDAERASAKAKVIDGKVIGPNGQS